MHAPADALPRRPVPLAPAASLRTRITLFVTASFLLLGVGFGMASYERARIDTARVAEATLAGQDQIWQKILQKRSEVVIEAAEALAAPASLVDAVARRDAGTAGVALEAGLADLGLAPAPAWAELVDQQGRVLYARRRSATGQSMADAGILARVIEHGTPVASLGTDGNGFVFGAVVPVRGMEGRVGALTLATPVTEAVEEMKASTGVEAFLVDAHWSPAVGTNPELWAEIQGAAGRYEPGLRLLRTEERALSIGTIPQFDGSGTRIGYLVTVQDISDSAGRERMMTLLALVGVGGFAALVLVVLHLFLHRAFRPLDTALSALNALTEGDTSVDVVGESRRDEIGRIARAVRIFRDKNLNLARERQRRERRQRRQQRFIRQQMQQLASTLDAEAREELLNDLEEIESHSRGGTGGTAPAAAGAVRVTDDLGATAVAFQVMAQRVQIQHHRLNALVAELREALQTKTELVNLQQQFAIANSMQASMLPQALPPRDDVEVRGALMPCPEFGGDFYDFFPLEAQRIAITTGNVGGGGLPAAFLSLTARTLMKSALTLGQGPAEAMASVNDLLTAENRQDLDVALLIGILDPREGTFTYCAAGCPAPLMIRRLGELVPLSASDNPSPGRRHGLAFEERRVEVPVRSTLFVHSPGLVDGRNKAGDPFGAERLAEALKSSGDLSVAVVINSVMSAVASHAGGERTRDASAVAIRSLGP